VAYDEIDLVIFLRDTRPLRKGTSRISTRFLKQCDSHSIPVATNIATAEVLIMGLCRGEPRLARTSSIQEQINSGCFLTYCLRHRQGWAKAF
jgi:methylglyoxal synthase